MKIYYRAGGHAYHSDPKCWTLVPRRRPGDVSTTRAAVFSRDVKIATDDRSIRNPAFSPRTGTTHDVPHERLTPCRVCVEKTWRPHGGGGMGPLRYGRNAR